MTETSEGPQDAESMGRPAGIVLAGGLSRRMGSDKAALDWGGEPMLRRIVRALSQRCAPILVVAAETSPAYRQQPELRPSGAGERSKISEPRWVTDEVPESGPLGGLAAGLAAAAAEGARWAFVCATDMPLIEPELIDELALGVTPSAQAVIASDAQRDHPMAALYRTDAASVIADLVASGERRMTAGIDALVAHRSSVSDPAWLTNVNSPEDLHRLRV